MNDQRPRTSHIYCRVRTVCAYCNALRNRQYRSDKIMGPSIRIRQVSSISKWLNPFRIFNGKSDVNIHDSHGHLASIENQYNFHDRKLCEPEHLEVSLDGLNGNLSGSSRSVHEFEKRLQGSEGTAPVLIFET